MSLQIILIHEFTTLLPAALSLIALIFCFTFIITLISCFNRINSTKLIDNI